MEQNKTAYDDLDVHQLINLIKTSLNSEAENSKLQALLESFLSHFKTGRLKKIKDKKLVQSLTEEAFVQPLFKKLEVLSELKQIHSFRTSLIHLYSLLDGQENVIVELNAIEMIISSLVELSETDLDMAIRALAHLSSKEVLREKIGNSGVVERAILVCRSKISNKPLMRSLLQFISNLCCGSTNNKIIIIQKEGLSDILTILHTYVRDEEMAIYCLSCLRNLSTFDDLKKIATEAEFVTEVLYIVRTHKSNERVVDMGLWTIINLVVNNDDNKKNVVEEKGLEIIYDSLKQFEYSEKIRVTCCTLVHMLARIASIREAFADTSIAIQICRIFKESEDDSSLLSCSLIALHRLSINEESRAQIIRFRIIDRVIEILKSGTSDQKTFLFAGKVLFNLCKDEQGKQQAIDKDVRSILQTVILSFAGTPEIRKITQRTLDLIDPKPVYNFRYGYSSATSGFEEESSEPALPGERLYPDLNTETEPLVPSTPPIATRTIKEDRPNDLLTRNVILHDNKPTRKNSRGRFPYGWLFGVGIGVPTVLLLVYVLFKKR